MVGRPPTRPQRPGVVGANVKRLRLAQGLSQQALADKAGLSRGAVQTAEAGKYKSVDTKTIELLAPALGVPLAQLLAPTAERGGPGALVRAFRASSWAEALKPTETEYLWLESLPEIVWWGLRPTVDTVAKILIWRRESQTKQP